MRGRWLSAKLSLSLSLACSLARSRARSLFLARSRSLFLLSSLCLSLSRTARSLFSPWVVLSSHICLYTFIHGHTRTFRYLVRRGPVLADKVRAASSIDYDRQAFTYPMVLVTPPIILQQRRHASTTCNTELGSLFQKKLWEDTVSGETCRTPYDCGDLLDDSTALMACSSTAAPVRFFGQDPLREDEKLRFFEFLQTVVEADIIRRGTEEPETFKAQEYFDAQTQEIQVILVAFSPEYGVASLLKISAQLSSEVSVDYSVTHFSSLENERLRAYTIATCVGMAISVVIFAEKVVTTLHRDWKEARFGFIFDVVIQVVAPLFYFSIRYVQLRESKGAIANSIGKLSAVPWASPDTLREDKVDEFFQGYHELNRVIASERNMSVLYFFFATLQLWRLIVQTKLHPRTAMLVNTILNALDDLWYR